MKKYKLNKDKKELTSNQINKYKDFKNLHANYDRLTKYEKQKPLYKDPKAFMALFLILLVAYLLYEFGF